MARKLQSAKKASPKTKKIQEMQDWIAKKQAFNKLLVLRHANGGRLSFGDITKVANDYQLRNFKKVTERHLHYRLQLLKQTGIVVLPSEHQPPTAELLVNQTEQTLINVLDLTNVNVCPVDDDTTTNEEEWLQRNNMSKSKKRNATKNQQCTYRIGNRPKRK
jgi:DNA-binding HxlR family transcriptional regulator